MEMTTPPLLWKVLLQLFSVMCVISCANLSLDVACGSSHDLWPLELRMLRRHKHGSTLWNRSRFLHYTVLDRHLCQKYLPAVRGHFDCEKRLSAG